MITGRDELTRHGLKRIHAPESMRRRHPVCTPRELYRSENFRLWFTDVLPTMKCTQYATYASPLIEAQIILGRFAAGAPMKVEPDEFRHGDIKRLDPHDASIWELKTGDVRIFGWFHVRDCFVAHVGDDATYTKANGLYGDHINTTLAFLQQSGLNALEGDHRYVLTC